MVAYTSIYTREAIPRVVYTIIHQEGYTHGSKPPYIHQGGYTQGLNLRIYTRETIPRVYNGGYTPGCTTVGI